MQKDSEGFLAPCVDDSVCISCGACAQTCPALNAPELEKTDLGYLALWLEQSNERSSSGGMATLLARTTLESGGAVAGCMMDADGYVHHALVESRADLVYLQGSKYVQSDTSTIWKSCRTVLDAGRTLLFIGTPCQVAAARRLFGENSGALYIDLVCHGVPSPLFWEKDLEHLRKRGVIAYPSGAQFRVRGGGSKTNYSLYDATVGRMFPHQEDAYYSAFVKDESYRESCYECPFATVHRVGDITLGDCATAEAYLDFHPDMPASVVLVNTDRGAGLLDKLPERTWDYASIDREREERENHCLHAPTPRPDVRSVIYKDLARMNYAEFADAYKQGVSVKDRAWLLIKRLFPIRVRIKIKKMIRRLS